MMTFQGKGVNGNLATAKKDHKDAYKQPPVKDGREMLAAATLNDPTTALLRGFIPQTQFPE